MWRRIISLIIKELLTSARDPQTRLVVLFSPPLWLVIYAFAITQEVSHVSMAVLNQDHGQISRELVARFEGSPTFENIVFLNSDAEIAPEMDAQRVAMVLRIGPDFSRRIAAGEQARLQVILDGRRSNSAQILGGYTARIVQQFNAELAARAPPAVGAVMPLLEVTSRVWFNPNFEPLWSAVPILFSVLISIVGFMVSSLAIARERELGTFEQLLVSPLQPFEILVGKTVPALVVALGSATAMLTLGWLVLQVPLRGSLILLFVSMTVYLSAIIGVGLFISAVSATQQQAIIGMFIYMIPAVLLSGYASPVENMPDWLQWLAETDPITHFIIVCKGVFLKNAPVDVILAHTLPMALIAAVTLSAGAWLFRRRVS